MVDEPVRGGFPDPSFSSLPGIEQARAWLRDLAPRVPLSHLMGIRPTQVGSGSATVTQPASPWLQTFERTVEGMTLLQTALELAVLTGALPGTEVPTAAFAVNHLRPCTLESETLVAKARTLNSGPTFTLAEVFLEDALGRGVAHATATFVIRPIEPPPPWTGSVAPLEHPVYSTPDPYQRALPDAAALLGDEESALSFLRQFVAGEVAPPPAARLLGIRWVEAAEGTVSTSLSASEWLCGRVRRVSPGVIAYLCSTAHGAVGTLMPVGHRLGVLNQSVTFLRQVSPDGQDLLARGTVTHQGEEFLVSHSEVTDSAGNTVAVGTQTSLFIPRRRRRAAPSSTEAERVMATVMFSDIVGSTGHAERLGDARWRDLLDEHHAVVRTQLQLFKGREVKTTGDGFLATFDSPGRGVQAARAIRDGVRRLGVEVRVGLHTGECELSGSDVAGIAVHIASRIQNLAAPGKILVSNTVHDLVTGSGLRFTDDGRHRLKGIEGDWQLFALEE